MKHGFEFHYTDTVVPYVISYDMREYELEKKLDEFRSAKLVITDRLHGMIFAAITGTPCVALNNISKKVEGVYQWIKYLDYIKMAQTVDDALLAADALLKANLHPIWDNKPLMSYFGKLADIVRGGAK
jgi:pyruvyl transferase EpsI